MKYVRYVFILIVACLCFILIDNVYAEVATMQPQRARISFDYTTNYGNGLNAYRIYTTAPEFPYIKSFTFDYRYNQAGNYNADYPLSSASNSCWRTSFQISAPTDHRPIDNYNRIADWKYGFDSTPTGELRWVRVYQVSDFFIYEFYIQKRETVGEFMVYNEKFTYTGNINPFTTDLDYSSNASWLGTEFIACSLIDDVKTTSEFDEVNSKIDGVNDRIDGVESSINSNIDDLKQKQEEAHETSKGIWASLKDGIANIGSWFSELASSIGNFFKELGESIANGFTALFESINKLFVGEEVCESTNKNLFTGYDIDGIYPDNDGWITLSYTSNSTGKFYKASLLEDLEVNKTYNVFIEFKNYSTNSLGRFFPISGNKGQLIGDGSSAIVLSNLSYTNVDWVQKDKLFNFKINSHSVDTYFFQSNLMNWNNGTTSITFRMLITDDLSMTVDNYQYLDKIQNCRTQGGLFGMLSDFFKSIGEFFGKLFGFIEDDSVDTDDAGGFFSGFDTEDNGGISSVITAPLVAVRKMTNQCQSIHIPFYDSDVELPCGTTLFWDKPEVQTFRTTWNMILGGTFIFFLLSKVFKVIEDIKDPESDKVEVMKL